MGKYTYYTGETNFIGQSTYYSGEIDFIGKSFNYTKRNVSMGKLFKFTGGMSLRRNPLTTIGKHFCKEFHLLH